MRLLLAGERRHRLLRRRLELERAVLCGELLDAALEVDVVHGRSHAPRAQVGALLAERLEPVVLEPLLQLLPGARLVEYGAAVPYP